MLNRNVTIVIIILVLVVIAGYLVWLRSRIQGEPVSPQLEQQVEVTPSPKTESESSPSATPGVKEATGSMKEKTSTPSSTGR